MRDKQVRRIHQLGKIIQERAKLDQKKLRASSMKKQMNIVELIKTSKIESARVRTEALIRDDMYLDALEQVELYADLLVTRCSMLETTMVCEEGMRDVLHSLIYASAKVDGKELQDLKIILGKRFGKKFVDDALMNYEDRVGERLKSKLTFRDVDPDLIDNYIKSIGEMYQCIPPRTEKELDIDERLKNLLK